MNKIEQMKLDLLRSKDSQTMSNNMIDPRDQSQYNTLQGYNNGRHSQGDKIFRKQLSQVKQGFIPCNPIKIVILTGSLKGSYDFKDQKNLNKFISESKALIGKYKIYINGVYTP